LHCLRFVDSASGEVFSAEVKATGQKVAIKQMNLFKQPRLDLLAEEIALARRLRHDNIVNYIEGFLIDGRPSVCQLWAVTELLEGGSLHPVVAKTVLLDGQIAGVTRSCVRALDYLHSNVRHFVLLHLFSCTSARA
jgi:serine/threonine protein kinase